jgi:hypothetical protein
MLYYGTKPVPIINPAKNSKKPIGVNMRFHPFFIGTTTLFVEFDVLFVVEFVVVPLVVVF